MILGPFDMAREKTCTGIGRLKSSVRCVPLVDWYERYRKRSSLHPAAILQWPQPYSTERVRRER